MNLTRERWGGDRASTRTGRREASIEHQARVIQTLAAATSRAENEAHRRERTLVYQVRGCNLGGPLRERTENGSRLASGAPSRRGTFLVCAPGRPAERVVVSGS